MLAEVHNGVFEILLVVASVPDVSFLKLFFMVEKNVDFSLMLLTLDFLPSAAFEISPAAVLLSVLRNVAFTIKEKNRI